MLAPTLTDGVVTLRPHRTSDAPGVLEQSLDPESQRWTTVPVPYTLADAEEYVGEMVPRGWADGSSWTFALEAEGRFAGSVDLRDLGGDRADLGFGAHPWARGTGYVERGVRLLLEWGFAERGLRTVSWRAHLGNWASRRLAWKLGFTIEGTIRQWSPQRGELRDVWVGTLLRDDPRSPRTTWLDNPVVAGDGVRLRPLTEADVPRVVEGIGDPITQHLLAFMPRDPDEETGRRYLQQVTERLATGATLTWGWCAADDDRLLGVVGIYRLDGDPEVGYWTHPDARGRGLTTRAAATAVDYAFDVLGLPRLAGYASAINVASLAVLEKLGMQRTGVQRQAVRLADGTPADLVGYDLLAAEWADQKSTAMPATERSAPTSAGER